MDQFQNLDQTSAYRLNLNFKILTKPSLRISTKVQLHNLYVIYTPLDTPWSCKSHFWPKGSLIWLIVSTDVFATSACPRRAWLRTIIDQQKIVDLQKHSRNISTRTKSSIVFELQKLWPTLGHLRIKKTSFQNAFGDQFCISSSFKLIWIQREEISTSQTNGCTQKCHFEAFVISYS